MFINIFGTYYDFSEITDKIAEIRNYLFKLIFRERYDYLNYLEDNYSSVIYSFCNLSKIYNAETVISLADERNEEHFKELYREDIEDILLENLEDSTKEELIEDLRSYLDIDEEYSKNKMKNNKYWTDYFKNRDEKGELLNES